MKPTQFALAPRPGDLRTVCHQFEAWRQVRRPGTPIPASLWAAVVAVAQGYGVNRTALALHLDAHKLRAMTDARRSVGRPGPTPTFVEVRPTPPAGHEPECTIDIAGPRGGRLRVAVRGAAPPDVVALSRVVWGRGR